MNSLTLPYADDCHLHLREGHALDRTVADATTYCARAIVMPNLITPVTTVKQALHYRQAILTACPKEVRWQPLMTLYLTDDLPVDTIAQAGQCEHIFAAKLYPAASTTHSQAGVTSIKALYPIFSAMQDIDLPLLIHGEVTTLETDIFAREKQFIDKELVPLIKDFPKLRIVLEHVSTQYAVEFILASPANIAATITAHHLLLNRNDLLVGGIKPHHYCLPILKKRSDQIALITAATGGSGKFFLGSDSAPHIQHSKESACGCAGIYTAHAALSFYAEVFEQADALSQLPGFASQFGADFYHLPRNQKTLTLVKKSQKIPDSLDFSGDKLIPLRAGGNVSWSILKDDAS
ncbi:MAG: dihydroorotase [Gammaproteobacteria bacterium]